MKHLKKTTSLIIILFLLGVTFACTDEHSLLLPEDETSTVKAALQKIVDEDEALDSFEPNYNEDEAMNYVLGKTTSEIFPVRVGQKMKMIDKNLNVVFEGDTAYGTLTTTFEGILFIVASPDTITGNLDSLNFDIYEKPFTTTLTRKIIFVKKDNTNNPLNNWRISAVSLVEGGTLDDNIEIKKMTVFLPDGESIIVEEPNEYFLSRGPNFKKSIPILSKFETVTVKVEIQSVYPDKDFVTLTYGALRSNRMKRAKKRFSLIKEEFDGTYYNRVYEAKWQIHQSRGFRHAVVNAYPYRVIKDSEAPVESNSWGMPYLVK